MIGLIAAVPTVLILMLAGATYRDAGAYTPLYSVVSIFDPGPLETALQSLAQGRAAAFVQEPFVAGLAVCLGLGAISGVVFALGLRRRSVRRRGALLIVGPAHGLFMMSVFYFGVLMPVGQMADAEWAASSLGEIVGWPTLVVAHAVYGLVLGIWYAYVRVSLSPRRFGDRGGS